MAILENEVWIVLSSPNMKHYEALGYDIPKIKNKRGKLQTPEGTKILIKIEDLPLKSNIKLTKICDDCRKPIPNQSLQNILRSREKNGKDKCRRCVSAINRNLKLENLEYKKTLEYYALTNDKEYLLSEFSPKNTKNPKDISQKSTYDCLWICPTYKHEYDMKVVNRTYHNNNCPYCSKPSRKVLKGFNDLWTTHPQIAKLLKDEQRGYEISAGRNEKEDFICEHCSFEKKLAVHQVVGRGLSCPKCSDGLSYPEKFVFECLKQLKIDFEFQKTFDWSINPKSCGNKRYDFHIPVLNMIIETHGIQHFKEKTGHFGNVPLKEEQENDKIKETLAVKNGVETYVVLDCSLSEMEHIKNSVMLSCLSTIFNLDHVDWLRCHEFSCHSLVKTTCDLWNKGNKMLEICKIIKLSQDTIRKYLKQGKVLGWCDYEPKEVLKLNGINAGKNNRKEIVQLTLNGEFIKCWDSASQIREVLRINNISKSCKGKQKHAGGFKWMYKEDYEGLLK